MPVEEVETGAVKKWKDTSPPKWFNIDAYAYLATLDATGWYELITKKLYGQTHLRPLFPEQNAAPIVPSIIPVQEMQFANDVHPHQRRHTPHIKMSIDLRARDDVLIKEIKAVITSNRAYLKLPNPGKSRGRSGNTSTVAFTKAVLRTWHSRKIIPLWDLELQGTERGISFNDVQLGRWLFPNTLKPGQEIEKTRKTLQDACRALSALRAYLKL